MLFKHSIHKLTAMLVLAAGFYLIPQTVSAQISCTGDACAQLPLNQSQLDQMYIDFSSQIAKPLVKNYAKASANANTMTPLIGSVNLRGWTLGGTASAGYYEAATSDVYISNVGTLEDITPSAAQLSPYLYFGVNLGSLLGTAYNPYEDEKQERVPGLFSPARFDIYLMLLKHTHRQRIEEDGELVGRGRYTVANKGVQVRYHLMYGKNIFTSALRWNGASLSVAMMDSSTRASFSDSAASSYEFSLDQGNKLVWLGNYNVARISSSIKSYPVELQTGIDVLYLLTLTGGAGVAWHHGRTELTVYRSGQAFLDSDLAALFGLSTSSSYLSLYLHEEDAPPAFTYYGKLGVELNLAFIKVGVSAMATDEKSYGGNIGIRMEF